MCPYISTVCISDARPSPVYHEGPPHPSQTLKMTPGPRPLTPIPAGSRSLSLPFRWPNYLTPSILFSRQIPKPQFLRSQPLETSSAQNGDDDDDNDTSSSDSSYDSAITSPRSDSSTTSTTSTSSSTHHLSPSLVSLSGSVAAPSTTTTSSSSHNISPAPLPTPSPTPNYLYGSTSILKCCRCQSDICFSETIISKGFNGRYGRAYLCNPIPTHAHTLAKPTIRQLVTGSHLVADISCSVCLAPLGWKYISASDPYQQYKVGKYILETKSVTRVAHWQSHQARPQSSSTNTSSSTQKNLTSWDFDIDTGKRELAQAEEWGDVNSEDEEELEDMFLGKWTPKLAAKRRRTWENQTRKREVDIAQQIVVG